jgi:hypothetical protein
MLAVRVCDGSMIEQVLLTLSCYLLFSVVFACFVILVQACTRYPEVLTSTKLAVGHLKLGRRSGTVCVISTVSYCKHLLN